MARRSWAAPALGFANVKHQVDLGGMGPVQIVDVERAHAADQIRARLEVSAMTGGAGTSPASAGSKLSSPKSTLSGPIRFESGIPVIEDDVDQDDVEIGPAAASAAQRPVIDQPLSWVHVGPDRIGLGDRGTLRCNGLRVVMIQQAKAAQKARLSSHNLRHADC